MISVVLLILTLIANRKQQTYQSKAQEIPSPPVEQTATVSAQLMKLRGEIEEKNTGILGVLEEYKQGDALKKQELIPLLSQKARERTTTLLALLEESPREVYTHAFTQDTLSQFPQETQAILEKRVTTTGTVNTYIFDNFEENTSFETATFVEEKTDEEMNFYAVQDNPISFLSGTVINVNNAVKLQEPIQPESLSSNNGLIKPVFAQDFVGSDLRTILSIITIDFVYIKTQNFETIGPQSILFILAIDSDILNSDLIPPSPEIVSEKINKYTKKFYEKISYNKLRLMPTIYPRWLPIDLHPQQFTDFEQRYKYASKKQLMQLALENNINIGQYQRLFFILATNKKSPYYGGYASIGGKDITTVNGKYVLSGSIAVGLYYFNDPDYLFTRVIPHEIGHNLGAAHAGSIGFCGLSILESNLQRYFVDQKIGEIGIKNGTIPCKYVEYGNPFDVMGRGGVDKDNDFNPFIKRKFGWLSNDQIIDIDQEKPNGTYTIQKYNDYATQKNFPNAVQISVKNSEEQNYYLYYRNVSYDTNLDLGEFNLDKNNVDSLAVDFELFPQKLYDNQHYLERTILLKPPASSRYLMSPLGSEKNTFTLVGFPIGQKFTDNVHNLVITVEKANKKEGTLTFSISSCDEKPSVIYSTGQAGLYTASVNVFENDLLKQGVLTHSLSIFIEEKSECEKNIYSFTSSQEMTQGTLRVDPPHFAQQQIEFYKLHPFDYMKTNTLTTNVRIFEPTPIDTKLFFKVSKNKESGETMTTTNGAVEYHLVPSTEEYKNDLEPNLLFVKNLNDPQRLYNIQVKKGEKLILKASLRNNSRNPSGNKSRDFQVKWSILDEKGNNQIPPFFKRVDGISPQGSTSQELEWTVPDDVIPGDYRVVFEADPRGRIEEFNENNNQIWRDFTVVEDNETKQ